MPDPKVPGFINQDPNTVGFGLNQNPQQPTKEYDFFTLVLNNSRAQGEKYDVNNHLIDLKVKLDETPGEDVVWKDKDFLWEKNKTKYGGNREMFEKDYGNVSQLYDKYRKNELDYYSYASPTNFYTAIGLKPVSGVGVVVDQKPLANYGWMDKFQWNLTPDQMAAMSGKYKDKNGELKDFTWDVKYNPFKSLVVDQDVNTGDYSLRETSMTEDVSNQRMYSFWGSQSKYGNAIMNTVGGFLSELLPGTIETVANLKKIEYGASDSLKKSMMGGDMDFMKLENGFGNASMVGDLLTGKFFSDKIEDALFDKVLPDMKRDAVNAIANFANRMKFHPSEEAEQAGWFGSMEGFMTQLGRGLSYLVPQRAAAMGVAKLMTKAGSKALTAQFVAKYGAEEGTKLATDFIAKNGYKLSKGEMSMVNMAGFGTGTVQAMSGVYNTAKQNGLSDAEASWMSIVASPFVYMTEKMVGGGWLWKELQSVEGKTLWNESIKKMLKHEITENGFQSAKELTEKNYINIGKNAMTSFLKGSKDLGFKAFRSGKDLPFVGAGVKEGTQEFSEESLYIGEEMIFDKINEMNGKMASYNTSLDSDETFNRLRDSWFGGFFIGGVADAYLHKGKTRDQKDAIVDAIINGKEKEFADYITDLKNKGGLGQVHLAEDGSIISQDQTGQVKSMNDVNYDNIMQQFEFYKNLYKVGGLNTKEMMDNVGGDVSIVKEGMDNLLSQYNINQEISSIGQELEKAQKSGLSTEQLQKDLAIKQQELKTTQSAYQDISSGKRLADLTKESLIKNLYNQAGDQLANTDVVTPNSQNEFNDSIPVKKKAEIERLKTERDKIEAERINAGNIVSEFEKLDVNNFDQQFADTLSKVKQMSESGALTENDSKKLVAQIEKKKNELIASLETSLDETRIADIRSTATIDMGEGETDLDTEMYIASLLKESRIAPTLRTDIRPGDIVQRVDKDGNSIDKEAPVLGILEDGSLLLNEGAEPIDKAEVKNISAQQELDAETDKVNKRSKMDNAYQTLSGIRNKYTDLNEAYGYNDDEFTALLYSSIDIDGIPQSIEHQLQRMSGIAPEAKAQMSSEEYDEALKASPLMQLPENKTALENSIRVLRNGESRLLINFNIYQKLSRKMSGLTDENTLSEQQFLTTAHYILQLITDAQHMLDIMDTARLNREARQSVFRIQNLKISHFLLGETLKNLKSEDAVSLNKILMDAKTEIDNLDQAKAEGKDITTESWIPLKQYIVAAESVVHKAMDKDPKIAEKTIKDIMTLHDMKTTAYTGASEFNNNTVDEMINVGNFVTPVKQNKSGIPEAYLKQFILFYSVNYYQNVSRLDAVDFASAFKATIDESTDLDNVPSFEQESLINHIVSFLNSSEDGLIEFSNKENNRASIDNFLWNTIFLRGFYGTGKTTTISKLALKTYSKLNGKKPKVIVVAPSQKLANKLKDVVADEVSEISVMTNDSFFADAEGIVNNYDIVLFDEASRLSKDNLNRVNEILNGKKSNNTIKAIMMGDQSQMQSVKEADKRLPVELRTERTMPATEIYRSGVEDIWIVLEALRLKMRGLDNNFVIPPTKYTKDKSRGVLQLPTNDLAVIIKEFIDDVLANSEHIQNTAIVTFSDKDRARVMNMLLANAELVTKVTQEKLESMVYHLDEGEMNAQGSQFERVYVAITQSMMPPDVANTVLLSRALLTAGSRAMNYLVMPNEQGQSIPGPVANVLPDTIDSRKTKLDSLRKWWEWATPTGENPITKDEKEQAEEGILKAVAVGEEKSTKSKAPISKPSSGEYKVGDTVIINAPKTQADNGLNFLIGQTGKIKSFVINDGYKKPHYDSYDDFKKAMKQNVSKAAYFEITVGANDHLVPANQIGIYNKKAAEKQEAKTPLENQDSVSKEQLSKMGIILNGPYTSKSTGTIVKVTRAFKKGAGTMIVLDGNEKAPIASSAFKKDFVSNKITEVLSEEKAPILSEAQNSSQLFVSSNKATFGLLANQGAEDQDNPNDPYVKFKRALIAHLSNSGPIPVTLAFEQNAVLASRSGQQSFANVVTVRYNNVTDLQAIAKRAGVKVDLDKANLIGALPNPSLGTESRDLVNNANYSNETDVKRLLNSVVGESAEAQWNRFLIQVRQQLALKGPMSTTFLGTKGGSLEKVKDGDPRIGVGQLIDTLRKKGFEVETDKFYFDNTLVGKNGPFASVIMNVQAGPGLSKQPVYLDSEQVNDAYFKKALKEVSVLKETSGLTFADLDNSLPFKFLLFNSSRIYKNGNWQIAGLDQFLEIKDEGWIDIKGAKASQKIGNLISAVTLLNDLFKNGDLHVKNFNQLVTKRTQGGLFIVDPNATYVTRVRDVNFPLGELDVSVIKTAINQANQNNITPPATGRKPFVLPTVKKAKRKDNPGLLNNTEKRELRASVEQYYERVFGKAFLENRLEFKRALNLNDDELYGLVSRGIVYLEETEQGIESRTKRHEAVHIALNYLISPETKYDLLSDARTSLSEKTGQDRSYITDEQAEEHIAERYETRYEGIGGLFNRLIDRFTNWLKGVFGNAETYKEEIDDLLYAIESGRFKDQPFYDNDSDVVAPKRKPKKSNQDNIQKFGEEDNSDLGEDVASGVIKEFSDLENLDLGSDEDETIDADYSDTIQEANNKKKKQDPTKNYAALAGIFGNIDQVNLIRRTLAARVLESSNYDRSIEYSGISMIDLLKEVRDKYKVEANRIPQTLNIPSDPTITSFVQINGTNIHLISDNEEQLNQFITLKLADDVVFNTFVKKMFPNINFQKEDLNLFKKEENSEHEEERGTEEGLMANNEININNKNDEKDPFTKMSQHVYFHLNNMRKNVYAYDQNGNRILIGKSDKFVSVEKLKMFLTRAAIDSQLPSNEYEKTLNDQQRFILHIRNMAQTASIKNSLGEDTSDIADTLWSFFDTFLNDQPIVPADINGEPQSPEYSHHYLAQYSKELINNFPEFADNIKEKSTHSDEIFNSVFSFYHSLRSNSFAQLNYYKDRNGNLFVYKSSASPHEVARLKNEINSKVLSTMFIKSLDTASSVSEFFAEKMVDEKKKFFNVTKDNIFIYRKGQNTSLVSVDVKNGLPVFKLADNVTPSDIRSAFKQMGVPITTRTIQLFLGNDNSTGRLTHDYTRQKLAEILGMYVFSGYSASVDGPHIVKTLVQRYYDKHGFKIDSTFRKDNPEIEPSNDVESEKTSQVADNVTYFHKPSDLFPLTDILARAINYTHGRETANFYVSVNGNKKTLVTYKAYIDIFLSQTTSDEFVGSKLKLNREIFLAKQPALANLSYLNPSSFEGIIKVESLDGSLDNMKRGKELGRMNDGELADGFVHAFVNSVMESQGGSEKLAVPFHNIADKDVFKVMTINLAQDDVNRFLQKKGDTWSVNKSILVKNINDLFRYSNEVQETSMKGLYAMVASSGLVSPGVNFSSLENMLADENSMLMSSEMINIWEKVKNDPAALNTYKEFVKNVKKNSGLKVTRDFLILTDTVNGVEQEVLMPGKAIHYSFLTDNAIEFRSKSTSNPALFAKYAKAAQGHNIFNIYNQQHLFQAYQEGVDETQEDYDRIKDIFGRQYNGFTDFLKSVRHSKPVSIQDLFLGNTGTSVFRKPIVDVEKTDKVRNLNEARNWDWNPFYEGFFFSYLINDVQTSAIFMGDYSLYKDYTDFLKRSSKLEAPGQYANTSDPRGIGKTSKVVIFDDKKSAIFKELDEYRKSKGLPVSGKYEPFNGAGYMNPIWYHLFDRSFGGSIGSLGFGVLKPVHSDNGIYLKYADTIITGQMIENSPEMAVLMDKMFISNELKSMFAGMVEQKKAAGSTMAKAFWDSTKEMADYIGENGLQDQIISQYIGTSSVKEGAQNINDLEDDQFVPITINNEYTRIQTNLEQDIETTELSNYNQIYSQMSIGSHNTERVHRLNKLQEQIADNYIAYIEKNIRKRVKQNGGSTAEAWTSYFKEMGLNATQNMGSIGFFVDLLNNPSSSINIPILRKRLKQYFGNNITQNAIKPKMNGVRHNQTPGALFKVYDFNGQVVTHADIVRLSDSGVDVSSAIARQLKPMRLEGGKMAPAEVIIPFSYVKAFGINSDMTLQQARDFIAAKNPDSLDAFERSLNVIIGRIPANSPSSAFVGKAVGFINDASNTVIFPDEHNVLTGADNDGDQVNVYFYGLSRDSIGNLKVNNLPEDNSDVALRNKILDTIFEYYSDGANFDLIYTPIELESFRKTLSEQLSIVENKKRSFAPNTPQAFMFMSRLINEGKNMTGRFANSIKTYAFLVQANNVNNGKDSTSKARDLTSFKLNDDGKNDSNQYVLEFLGRLLQASVDNAKELILGALGVDTNNGNILSAMAVEGFSPVQAFTFFSKPHISKVFNDLYFSSRLTEYRRNKYGDKFGMLDEIEEKIERLKDATDNSIIVPADQELRNFNKVQKNKSTVVDEEEVDSFYAGQLREDDFTEYLNNPETKLNEILLRRQTERAEALKDLRQLKIFEMKGTALFRLSQAVGVNTKGVPVFEYEMDKYINDLEFVLNQPIDNYFSDRPAPVEKDYWESKKRFITKEAMDELKVQEKQIRSAINISEVINNLPHLRKYLEIVNWTKGIYQQNFIHDSKFVKSVERKFLDAIGINSLSYEGGYKEFYSEFEKFMIALFFDNQYSNVAYDNVLTTLQGQDALTISTPEGRVRFGYQFPAYIKNEFFNNAIASSELKNEYAENSFLQRLEFVEENNGMYVQLKDSLNVTDDQMSQLRHDFSKLDNDMQEMFTNYFLMKDDFTERKGSIMKVIGAQAFNKYSAFVDSFHELIKKTDDGKPAYYTTANGNTSTIDELFDNSFLKDVFDNTKSLLLNERKLKQKGIDVADYPRYWNVSAKKGAYDQLYFTSKSDPTVLLRSKYMARFNRYQPGESTITSIPTLQTMNWNDYAKIKTRRFDDSVYGVEVKFKGQTSFKKMDKVFIIDGTLVEITRVTNRNSVFMRPVGQTDIDIPVASLDDHADFKAKLLAATDSYKNITTKKEFLVNISKNSMNVYYKELALALMNSPRIENVYKKGSVHWVDFTHPMIISAYPANPRAVSAAFTPGAKDIYMVKEKTISPFAAEKNFLHELIHNLTLDTIRKPASLLTPEEQEFVRALNELYVEALASDGKTGSRFKVQLRNLEEFVTESLTNPDLQDMLSETVSNVNTKSLSLWSKLMDILSRFFSGPAHQHYVPGSVLGGVLRATGNFLTTPVTEEELREVSRIFGRMSEVKEENVDEMINNCK